MTTRALKFGVVGCGRISTNHLQALSSNHIQAELVAIADIQEDRARDKSEQYHVPYYLDHHEMLKRHPTST